MSSNTPLLTYSTEDSLVKEHSQIQQRQKRAGEGKQLPKPGGRRISRNNELPQPNQPPQPNVETVIQLPEAMSDGIMPQPDVTRSYVPDVTRSYVPSPVEAPTPRIRKPSVTESPRTRSPSVTESPRTMNASVMESPRTRSPSVAEPPRTRKPSVTLEQGPARSQPPPIAEMPRSRGSIKGMRGLKPLHVSFGELQVANSDHMQGKGPVMSDQRKKHNLHPLSRFRSLALTTNSRARRSRRSRNSVYSIDPSLLERPGRIREINSMEEFQERLDQAKEALVCVTFSAKWCGPWRMIKPDVHRLSHIHGDVEFYEIDVDDNEEIAEARRVACMPTFQFFKRGIMLDKFAEPNRIKLDETIRKLRKMEIRPEE